MPWLCHPRRQKLTPIKAGSYSTPWSLPMDVRLQFPVFCPVPRRLITFRMSQAVKGLRCNVFLPLPAESFWQQYMQYYISTWDMFNVDHRLCRSLKWTNTALHFHYLMHDTQWSIWIQKYNYYDTSCCNITKLLCRTITLHYVQVSFHSELFTLLFIKILGRWIRWDFFSHYYEEEKSRCWKRGRYRIFGDFNSPFFSLTWIQHTVYTGTCRNTYSHPFLQSPHLRSTLLWPMLKHTCSLR